MGGVVDAVGLLLMRTYYHGNYAVRGVIVRCDVTGRGQSPIADSEEPDLGLPVGIVHYLWVSIPAHSHAHTVKYLILKIF